MDPPTHNANRRRYRAGIGRAGRAVCRPPVCGRRWALLAPLAVLALLIGAAPAVGVEGSWEYSPYQVEVWLAAQPSPLLSAAVQQQLLDDLPVLAPLYAGATWRVTARPAPTGLQGSLCAALEQISVAQVVAALPEEDPWPDKVMLLVAEELPGGIRLACRECDLRTRTLGNPGYRDSPQIIRLARDVADLVAETFAPLVRIETTRGKHAAVRVRAGGLVVEPDNVSRVGEGDVLRPVLRRNDRRGAPRPDGIQVLDWTYLLVREHQDPLFECDVYSAMRNPLGGRSSPSLERFALKVRPRGSSTLLQLVAGSTSGSASGGASGGEPLEGYAVFARAPLADDSGTGTSSVRLGVTDWRGMLLIDQGVLPLRILYVKNGRQLLARLPLVPGLEPLQTIALPSDDERLEAEAFVRGLENRVMDLVARREILAARIRARLRDRKLDEARQYLEDLKRLPVQDDFEAVLVSHRQAGATAADPRQLQRIDQMLGGARILLARHLNPQMIVQLEREVDSAAAGGTPAPAEEPPAALEAAGEPTTSATN